jgi:hypothetical protein
MTIESIFLVLVVTIYLKEGPTLYHPKQDPSSSSKANKLRVFQQTKLVWALYQPSSSDDYTGILGFCTDNLAKRPQLDLYIRMSIYYRFADLSPNQVRIASLPECMLYFRASLGSHNDRSVLVNT